MTSSTEEVRRRGVFKRWHKMRGWAEDDIILKHSFFANFPNFSTDFMTQFWEEQYGNFNTVNVLHVHAMVNKHKKYSIKI